MGLKKLKSGVNPPHDVNVIIEIPVGSPPVKYEIDKDSGLLFVNIFWHTSMVYPANYGFTPQTLAEDGPPQGAPQAGGVAPPPGPLRGGDAGQE
jgi:inorganic pyrophosphatase